MSIYYGHDFVNLQCINFVSIVSDADKVIKVKVLCHLVACWKLKPNLKLQEWYKCINDCILNPKTQNLSPLEQLEKFRVILLYGKSILDEKTKSYVLPVQT